MSRERIALAIVLLLVFKVSDARTTNPEACLHFQVLAGFVIIVPVSVNGRGPYDFVFDTGNESTIIDTNLAQQLGVTAIDQIHVESSNGSATLSRAFADEISLGPARVRNSELLIAPLQSVHSVSSRIRGIIGQNFLKHFDYIIDNAHSVIDIAEDQSMPSINGMRVSFVRSRDRPLLPVKVGGSQLNFVLDSGASNVVVYSQSQSPSLAFSGGINSSAAEMRSSSGSTRVSMGRIDTLEVAGRRFGNLQAAVMNGVSNQEADGLLPTRFFSQIYVSNSGGYVVVADAR